MDIPIEIWIDILKYLKYDLQSLANFARVSKYYNMISKNDYLWQYFCSKFKKDELIEYKKRKEENWKQLYIIFSKNIKIVYYNNLIVLKGNNRLYINDNNIDRQLLIYDPEKNDKLLNIINIYINTYWGPDKNLIIITDDNRMYNIYLYDDINIIEHEINLHEIYIYGKNDIIKNIIFTFKYIFVIIKNFNNYKLFISDNNDLDHFSIIPSLNFNIIDIIYFDDCYKFIYLDNFNNLKFIKMTINEIRELIILNYDISY